MRAGKQIEVVCRHLPGQAAKQSRRRASEHGHKCNTCRKYPFLSAYQVYIDLLGVL